MASPSSGSSTGRDFRPHTASPNSCLHELAADLLTSKTDFNPERRFFRCRLRNTENDCGYFKWFDDEMPSLQKNQFLAMKGERDRLHEQLRAKVEIEKLLNENLRMRQSTVEDLRSIITNLDKRIEDMMVNKEHLVDNVRTLKKELNAWEIYM